MKTLSYSTIEKGSWGDGLWQEEPDKKQWLDQATGLPCLAVRNRIMGFWCGYVGVPKDHPHHGLGYGAIDNDIMVHGGLTYADTCRPGMTETTGVCHVVEPDEPDFGVWWFGFDCGHFDDYQPAMREFGGLESMGGYRTLEYVENECRKLAAQLKERS